MNLLRVAVAAAVACGRQPQLEGGEHQVGSAAVPATCLSGVVGASAGAGLVVEEVVAGAQVGAPREILVQVQPLAAAAAGVSEAAAAEAEAAAAEAAAEAAEAEVVVEAETDSKSHLIQSVEEALVVA